MKKEFYLELWLGTVAFALMFVFLLLGWITFVSVAVFIFRMDEPLGFRLVMGGFAFLILIPLSYGVWGCHKLFKTRWAYKRDFAPRISDHFEPALLTAKVTFFGRWPQVGAYHECAIEFPSGKSTVRLTPKFVSARAFDAIATSTTLGQVKWEGEVLWRDGFPYLFRDESFRLWFIPAELDDKPTKVL